MSPSLHIISSMATRQLLSDLDRVFRPALPLPVRVESVGGVDAAKRVQAGEVFDGVVLAANVIDQLIEAGRILPGSRVDLVRSGVAVAVKAGAALPDIGSEAALREAVLAARSLGYSTGPSGVHLVKLFERWGIADQIKDRIVQAPAGVPVGSLVASGQVDLGFQQLAELIHLPGIQIVGPLPAAVQIITTFSGGVAATSERAEAVRDWLALLASPAASEAKHANGMEPA